MKHRLRGTLGSNGALAILVVALLVTLREIDRLVAQVLSESGRTHSLWSVIGPDSGAALDAWSDWASAAYSPAALIVLYGILRILIAAVVFVVGRRLLERFTAVPAEPSRKPRVDAGPPPRAPLLLGAAILLTVLQSLLLIALALALGVAGTAGGQVLAIAQAVLAYLVLLSWLAVAGHIVLGTGVAARLRAAIPTALAALYAQRLSASVVFGVTVISLIGVDGVFELMSDVYRSALQYPPAGSSAPLAIDAWPIVSSAIAFSITGLGLLALGRERARTYRDRSREAGDRPPPLHYPWFVLAGGVLLAAVVVGLATGGASVDPLTLAIFVTSVTALAAVSIAIRALRVKISAPFFAPRVLARADAVERMGDLLVALWISVWALGPFKAILSPLLLAATGQFADSRFADSFPAILAIELALLAAAIGAPVVLRRLLVRSDSMPGVAGALISGDPERAAEHARVYPVLGRAVTVISMSFIALCLVAPVPIAYGLGPVAMFVLLLGAWTTIVSSLLLALEKRAPLEIFQLLRLRSTPLVALLVVLPLAVTVIDGAPGLHAIRVQEDRTGQQRDTLEQAYASWRERQECSYLLPGSGLRVQPLVLVAAHGGGIRAATWTVDVLRELPRDGTCASAAPLLSSGASGGSVGLAAFQQEGNPLAPEEMDTVAIAGPGGLAVDATGLLAGDLVGGVTGVRVPSPADYGNPFGAPWAWRDHAGLQEETWEQNAPQFAEPWNTRPQSPTGYLVLNGTDSISGCKALVSQVDLKPNPLPAGTAEAPATPRCTGPDAELADAFDLQDYLGDDCMSDLSWAVAAGLSSRYPIVSPSARISSTKLPADCNEVSDLQLVDGGLTDTSALSTLSDLAPRLAKLISESNAQADGGTRPFVVPIVLYVRSDPGTDVTAQPDTTRPDILVPATSIGTAPFALISPAAWLTRLSDDLDNVCPVGTAADENCVRAVSGIRTAVPQGIVVVAPTTSPSVSVPLGWTLSSFARTRLRIEAETQAECGKAAPDPSYDCVLRGSYAELGDLLDLFEGDKPDR